MRCQDALCNQWCSLVKSHHARPNIPGTMAFIRDLFAGNVTVIRTRDPAPTTLPVRTALAVVVSATCGLAKRGLHSFAFPLPKRK
jgi:hypothetical protein